MIIRKAEFIKSAAEEKGFIIPDKPMIAVCGKSNVGKSSFINMLANQKKLAKTSNTPGRTRLVNYFDFGEFVLADLPGYGFASVSKSEKEKWAKTLDAFFKNNEHISHVFALIDIRHDPTLDDMKMHHYLYAYQLSFSIITTKADKLGKTRIKPRIQELAKILKVGEKNVVATSSETRYGKDVIIDKLDEIIRVYYENKTEAENEPETDVIDYSLIREEDETLDIESKNELVNDDVIEIKNNNTNKKQGE